MREHMGLYRGERIDNGEWVEGNLFIPDKVTRLDVPTEILMGTNVVRISYEVDPNTVGECTGLRDKNGKLIFEGDIVKQGSDQFVVNYGRHDLWCCGCCFQSHESVGFYLDASCGDLHSDDEAWHGLEIIGNIHDNPEILKGGEQ